jgi:hypothetical protein
MSPSLDPLACPSCEAALCSPDLLGRAWAATCYEECLRRCERCGVGYSNGLTDPTVIWREAHRNVPPQVREGLDAVLGAALNVTARERKRVRFGFSTSEDAVTWTVFRYLQQTEDLGSTLRHLLPALPSGEPTLLFWGAPVDERGVRVREALIAITDDLGESPDYRSEPDLLLWFPASALVSIEVKYRQGRNVCPRTAPSAYDRYILGTEAFCHPETARVSRCYELARNWRLGWELASHLGCEGFYLLNLASGKLLCQESTSLACFNRSIRTSGRRAFSTFSWDHFLKMIPSPQESSFTAYLSERFPDGSLIGQER